MKSKSFRELTDEELAQRREEVDRELFNLRMQQATAQVENPARIHLLRRDRARLLTLINERRSTTDE